MDERTNSRERERGRRETEKNATNLSFAQWTLNELDHMNERNAKMCMKSAETTQTEIKTKRN